MHNYYIFEKIKKCSPGYLTLVVQGCILLPMVDTHTPLVADLITVRHRGEWLHGFVISVEGRDFIVRFYDSTVPDKRLTNSRFQTIEQKGWMLQKTPNTCNG